VEGGAGAATAQRNPNALYEIDKLSLDHVTVFPDGQLNVEAVASVPGTAAFSRPVSAGESPHTIMPAIYTYKCILCVPGTAALARPVSAGRLGGGGCRADVHGMSVSQIDT
jgi:hypothetical protein